MTTSTQPSRKFGFHHLIFSISIILTAISTLAAQNAEIDSLRHLLAMDLPDTTRVQALNALSLSLIPDSLDVADELTDQALSLSQKIDFTTGVLAALKNKGIIDDFRGNLEEAVAWYQKGIRTIGNNNMWQKELIGFYVNIGVAYYLASDFGRALENYIEAEQLCSTYGSESLHAKVLNNLAVVYRNLDKYEDAIRMYQESVNLKENLGDSLGVANTLHNIGVVYSYIDEPEKMIAYLTTAQEMYKAMGEVGEAQSVNVSLGVAYHEMGQMEEAKTYLTQAFASEEMYVPPHIWMEGKLLLAKLHLDAKDFSTSNAMLQEIEPAVLNSNFIRTQQFFYDVKAHILYETGSYQDAFLNLQMHEKLKDSLRSEERVELEKEMETKYLTKEKEAQIQMQELELLKSERERLVYTIALVALIVILGLGFWLFWQRQKANRLLSEKNAQIQKALTEKEILLKEIHHRVKNNLQIISSLLSLQSRQIEDPKALEAIQEGRNRVNSMALIHKNLYQDENLVGVDTVEYIDKLTESLVSSYNINPESITIEKEIDPVKLDVDTIIPLGLILNELISNTLKYAFEGDRPGKIKMALKRVQDGLHLQIADNGKGLPPNFDVENLKSLGFRLVKAFAQKLEAVLQVHSRNGTQVELFIPNQKGIA